MTMAANEPKDPKEVMRDALRLFASGVGSGSVKVQQGAFTAIKEAFESESLPEAAGRGLIKATLFCVLHRYNQKASLSQAAAFLGWVAGKTGPEATAVAIAGAAVGLVPTSVYARGLGKRAFLFAKWLLGFLKTHGKETDKLAVEALVVLGGTVHRSGDARAKARLAHLLRTHAKLILALLETQDMEKIDAWALTLLSPILAKADGWGPKATALYVRSVVSAKATPPDCLLEGAKEIVAAMNAADWEKEVYPPLKKALLRGPEIALPVVGAFFKQAKVDVSAQAVDLAKSLGAHLIGKEDDIRVWAVAAFRGLSARVAEASVAGEVAAVLVGLYAGSSGKLATVAAKQGVLAALEGVGTGSGLSSEGLLRLSSAVLSPKLLGLLRDESVEAVQADGVRLVGAFALRCQTKLPDGLVGFFKDGLANKKTAAPIRVLLLETLNVSLKTNTLSGAMELGPQLGVAVEAGLKSSATVPTLQEALAALPLFLRLARLDPSLDTKLGAYWALLSGTELFLTADKLMKVADEAALRSAVEAAAVLVTDFADKLPTGAYPREVTRALTLGLVCPFYGVRSFASTAVAKILGLLEGAKFANDALKTLAQEMESGWVQKSFAELRKKDGKSSEDATDEGEGDWAKLVAAALLQLSASAVDATGDEGVELSVAAFPICATRELMERDGATFRRLILKLGFEPTPFVRLYGERLFTLLQTWPCEEHGGNGVRLLVGLCGTTVWERLLLPALAALPVAALAGITKEQAHIADTKPDTLFDTNLMQRFREENESALKGANMKRESKAYKYKDQLWELELKKELAKKKGQADTEDVKLSAKQSEQLAAKLAEEAAVRASVLDLTEPVRRVLLLLESGSSGMRWGESTCLPTLLEALAPLFRLQRSSRFAARLWVALGTQLAASAAEEVDAPPYLGELLGRTTLRLVRSVDGEGEEWAVEPLAGQTRRCLEMLARAAGLIKEETDEEEEQTGGEDDDEGLSMPLPLELFVYTLPLLRAVLIDRPTLFQGDDRDGTEELALRYAALHMESESGAYPGWLMPIAPAVGLLLELIGGRSGGSGVQASAAVALPELVTSLVSTEGDPELKATMHAALVRALLSFLAHPNETAREAAIRALHLLPDNPDEDYLSDSSSLGLSFRSRLWVSRYDDVDEVSAAAKELWADKLGLHTVEGMMPLLLDDVVHREECIRDPAAEALADWVGAFPAHLESVLSFLGSRYAELAVVPPPVYDEVGRLVQAVGEDVGCDARSGIAGALRTLSEHLPNELVSTFFAIIVPDGLGDRSSAVRDAMLSAAVAGLERHGEAHVGSLLKIFEGLMDALPSGSDGDLLRQSLVVLLGTLARHLDPTDPKIRPIVARLIESLSTPSQRVQEAVAACLPPLVPAIRGNVEELSQQLLGLLLGADAYGERRGAAYGLAGLVKGMGIVALRQLEIMQTLQEALADKKQPKHREGALLALAMLCQMLGKLFEPYVVQILPSLLIALGDHDTHVREAAEECARIVMGNLSGHGVKLVLPSLLRALEEDSWRTKCGSVELLGAMAFCAPKQLSSCLPAIVPPLIEVLSDSHIKVQKAGEQALKQIGQVIRNPEILSIVNILLAALEDPANKTKKCLQTLLKTKFVHYVDAASLALMMPVVRRAFEDRSTETRRMAAAIVSNIYSLTDHKDVEPYIPQLMPGLKKSLLDPVPEIRGVAAKAFGTMVAATGSQGIQKEILPWLKERLVAESNAVDRSGAAQGLAEVFGGLGAAALERMMPDVIRTASAEDVSPAVRDGYLMLYIYLPTVFGKEFLPWLPKAIPSILAALADESEFVRDTALKAGQRLINTYCESSQDLLLPQLERGLFNESWRIRYASVQLLGDFLFKITGVSGKMTTESRGDDDTFGSETMAKAMARILGEERKQRLLAGLYVARSDVALAVRQAAGHVWKVVVANTPRTLKEILPLLFQVLLGCLASPSAEKQQIAARCLGELVRKMGDRILVDVVPVLEEGLKSDHADQRQGVCIALSEIMSNTTRDMVLMYSQSLVPTVKIALSDSLPDVRKAAASTFEVLLGALGPTALDEVLAPLVDAMKSGQKATETTEGLACVVALKGREVLPFLIPKLTTAPVKWEALARISAAAGDAAIPHLPKIIDSLLTEMVKKESESEAIQEATLAMLLEVSDTDGVEVLTDVLLSTAKLSNKLRVHAARLVAKYIAATKMDLVEDFGESLFERLLNLYVSPDADVVQAAVEGLGSLGKTIDQADQLDYVNLVRAKVAELRRDRDPDSPIPGFTLPKGLQPVLMILREGVLSGGADTKERAADALGSVIAAADAAALKPHVVNVTGPLIRILGDRFPPSVKTAILGALGVFLAKVGALLKPFLPQLQSTFLKAVGETSSRDVRLRAAGALAQLLAIHPKPDVVATELVKALRTADDAALQETFLVAARGLLEKAGDRLTEASVNTLLELILPQLKNAEDGARRAGGGALGALAAKGALSDAHRESLLRETLFRREGSPGEKEAAALGTFVALVVDAAAVTAATSADSVRATLLASIGDELPVAVWGFRGVGAVLAHQLRSGEELDVKLATALGRGLNHTSNDIKILAASILATLGASHFWSPALLKAVVGMAVNGTKEKNSAVRLGSEEALVQLLGLREGDAKYAEYLALCDAGPKGALEEVYAKSLSKAAKKASIGVEPLDTTVHV